MRVWIIGQACRRDNLSRVITGIKERELRGA